MDKYRITSSSKSKSTPLGVVGLTTFRFEKVKPVKEISQELAQEMLNVLQDIYNKYEDYPPVWSKIDMGKIERILSEMNLREK